MIKIKEKKEVTLADLELNKIYFFNPKDKNLNGFKAKFVLYDELNKFIVVEDTIYHKRKRFSIDFIQNIEDLRDD